MANHYYWPTTPIITTLPTICLLGQVITICPTWDAAVLVWHPGNVWRVPQTAKRPATIQHYANLSCHCAPDLVKELALPHLLRRHGQWKEEVRYNDRVQVRPQANQLFTKPSTVAMAESCSKTCCAGLQSWGVASHNCKPTHYVTMMLDYMEQHFHEMSSLTIAHDAMSAINFD